MPGDSMKSGSVNDMMKMDTNNDGMLSKSEVKNEKTMMSKFDSMDTNKDGMLDHTEMSGMGGDMKSGGMDKGMTH